MQILLLLIPISLILIAIAGAVFVWAVNHRQFDDLDRHGFDVLDEIEDLDEIEHLDDSEHFDESERHGDDVSDVNHHQGVNDVPAATRIERTKTEF